MFRCFLVLALVGPPANVHRQVVYSFQVLEVRPECSPDGVGYPVTVVIRVEVANHTEGPLILAREFSAAPHYCVAASADDGTRGKCETSGGDLEIQAGDVPEPQFGPEPDRERFVVVLPGATHKTDVQAGFLAGNRRELERLAPDGPTGFALPGHHVMQTRIRTWPYVFVANGTVERLKKQWRRHGDLVADSVQTPFLPFELPKGMVRCDAP